jgi:hypothetical protein
MNSADRVTIAGALDAGTLSILARFPVVAATAVVPPGTPPGDAVVGVGGVAHPVRIEVLAVVTVATARDIVSRAQALPRPVWFVIAERVTEEARTILGESGIGYASAAGQLHLAMPGLLVHVEVSGLRAGTTSPAGRPRLSDPEERVIRALLLDPRQAWPVRELARRARVSVGLSHRVLTRLETEGIVSGEGDGTTRRRRVDDVARLFDAWVDAAEADGMEVVTAFRPAASPRELVAAMASAFDAAAIPYAFTGAAAAAIMAPGVGPAATVDAWIAWSTPLDAALLAIGAKAVGQGANIRLGHFPGDGPLAFAGMRAGVVCVDPVRLYGDLARVGGRGHPLATSLRQAIINR